MDDKIKRCLNCRFLFSPNFPEITREDIPVITPVCTYLETHLRRSENFLQLFYCMAHEMKESELTISTGEITGKESYYQIDTVTGEVVEND
jgi:hypothetical protein